MIRILLPVLLLLLGMGGGIGAGLVLRSEPARDGTAAPTPPAEPETHPDHDETAPGPANGSEYVRLNNQFVVPIVRNGAVRSLVVMSLTLEIAAGNNQVVFDHEPRLRDAFLQVLFAHANAGGFDGTFTQAAAMAPLREALSEAAHQILGAIARDVLIVDLTRQDA
jgi:hypothetical protein